MDTGKVIRECRESLKWTRARLADQSGKCVQTILTAENNHDCRVSTLVKLLDAMGYYIEVKRKPWPL